jgi:Rrf2 family protein
MFNKETEYALRSLIYIKLQNIKDRRPGTVEISREIEAPPFFTAKILQRLVRSGFLESLKGKNGGFYFDSGKPDLPLKTLISATEGDRSFSGCGIGMKNCNSANPCPLHDRYAPIRTAINELVSFETVQSLADKVHSKEMNLKNLTNEPETI